MLGEQQIKKYIIKSTHEPVTLIRIQLGYRKCKHAIH